MKSVYVQVNWPRHQALEEAQYVQPVIDAHGWPHAIVGFADLLTEDAPATLTALAKFPAMRGVRMQLHWHDNPLYRVASAPDLMNLSAFRRNFAHPTFILQHAGMLEDLTPSRRGAWRDGMKRMAGQPNIVSKLSGLGTFLHRNARRIYRL